MSDKSIIEIANAIRQMTQASNKDTMIYGTVESVEPLKIRISEKIVLTEKFLFLGQMCRPYKVKIPHKHQINGTTEFSYAVSGIKTGTVHVTQYDEETGEETGEEDETVNLGGATVEGYGVVVTELTGHKHVLDRVTTEDVHKKDTDYEKYVVIEIEPKLQEGDKVLMFAFNNYQMFYVAERIEKDEEEEEGGGE